MSQYPHSGLGREGQSKRTLKLIDNRKRMAEELQPSRSAADIGKAIDAARNAT